jgi:hypothetical protein
MKNLNTIAADLFEKIRGRFPNLTIGDEEGNVTNVPENARYFDFSFTNEGIESGKVSVSLDEESGITVIVGKDLAQGQIESIQDRWFNFLKELRIFAKKRLMSFDIRDINKSNLNKRDYKFLAANRSGEDNMNESKMYGTNRTSYQRIGNARLAIKHTQPINTESVNSRTQKIGSIYIESPDGERFKYPFVHLSGARAMARHVSEGGNAYDDFGKYISGLSEELNKLRKFNTYINRSGVMAETLGGYSDIVKERAGTIRKEIQNLQKEGYYKETVEGFSAPIVEDVPEDVAENWIDQLTIKQFNEELKDVFPYIYKLVGEATRAKALGPDDLDESGLQYYTGVKKHGKEYMKKAAQAGREGASQEELGRLKDKYSKAAKNKKTREEFELEQTFEDIMGQFSDLVCEECGNPSWRTFTESEKQKGLDGKACWKGYRRMGTKMKGGKRVDNCVKVKEADNIYNDPGLDWMKKHEPYIDYHIDAANNALKAGNEAEREKHRELARAHRKAQMKWEENRNDGSAETISRKVIQSSKEMGVDIDEGNAFAHAVRKAKMDGKKKGDKIQGPDGKEVTLEKEQKTPLGEFILSYFDRESGKFPKGETAVLTAVEKDYGDEYVKPAAGFIKRVESLTNEYKTQEALNSPYPETEMIKRLSGF